MSDLTTFTDSPVAPEPEFTPAALEAAGLAPEPAIEAPAEVPVEASGVFPEPEVAAAVEPIVEPVAEVAAAVEPIVEPVAEPAVAVASELEAPIEAPVTDGGIAPIEFDEEFDVDAERPTPLYHLEEEADEEEPAELEGLIEEIKAEPAVEPYEEVAAELEAEFPFEDEEDEYEYECEDEDEDAIDFTGPKGSTYEVTTIRTIKITIG